MNYDKFYSSSTEQEILDRIDEIIYMLNVIDNGNVDCSPDFLIEISKELNALAALHTSILTKISAEQETE